MCDAHELTPAPRSTLPLSPLPPAPRSNLPSLPSPHSPLSPLSSLSHLHSRDLERCRLLLGAGADSQAKSARGRTALELALQVDDMILWTELVCAPASMKLSCTRRHKHTPTLSLPLSLSLSLSLSLFAQHGASRGRPRPHTRLHIGQMPHLHLCKRQTRAWRMTWVHA